MANARKTIVKNGSQIFFVRFMCSLIILISMVGMAGEGDSSKEYDLESVEEMTQRWIDIRRELNARRERWKEQKAVLENRRRLLRKRRDELQEKVGELKKQNAKKEESLEERREAVDNDREIVKELGDTLQAARTEAEDRVSALPEFLKPGSAGGKSERRSGDLAGRVMEEAQQVFELWNRLGDLHRSVHVGQEVIEGPDGRQREAEVLYIGASRGFALLEEMDRAASRGPSGEAEGWQWGAVRADSVARALSMYRNEKAPGFVHLPLSTGGTAR